MSLWCPTSQRPYFRINWDTKCPWGKQNGTWNSRTSWGLWPKGKCSLCDITETERQLAAPQPPLRTALACTSEKLPSSSTDLQGGLHPSRHGNSLHSPILALPTFFLYLQKRTQKEEQCQEKSSKTKTVITNVIKTLRGFNPPAQSCLTEPAAIGEMFNSLHVPKQGARSHMWLLHLEIQMVGLLHWFWRLRLHTPDAAGTGLIPGRRN